MATGGSLGLAAGTDVPLEHLDYSYIGECTNVKEVEKLLKILRSGTEGTFPDLIEFTEKRLAVLDPANPLLLRENKRKTALRDLPSDEQQDLENDMEAWSQLMHSEDATLGEEDAARCNGEERQREVLKGLGLPPIRKTGVIGQKTKSAPNQTTHSSKSQTSQRIKSSDFRAWDRFDAEREAKRVDRGEEEEEREGVKSESWKKTAVKAELSQSEKNMTKIERSKLAVHEKEKGNESFRSGDFAEAVVYYSRSILLSPSTAAYNNRALMYIKLDRPTEAEADCNKVLDQEPDNLKALFRRATARVSLKEEVKAISDFEHLLQLDPSNKKAHDQLRKLRATCSSAAENILRKNRLHIVEVEGCGGEEGEGEEDEKENREGEGEEGESRDKRVVQGLLKTLEAKRTKGRGRRRGKANVGAESSRGKGEQSGMERSRKPDDKMTENLPQKPVNRSQPSTSVQATPLPAMNTPSPVKTTPISDQATPPPLPPALQELKEEGNRLFRSGQYSDASVKYSLAIHQLEKGGKEQVTPQATLLNNRAACFLKTGECDRCIEDCSRSISLLPRNPKALLRRASAYELKEKYQEAYMDFHLCLRLDSSVQLAQQATTRLARHLQDQYGLDWRAKLPPHPDTDHILGAHTAQQVVTPTDADRTQVTPDDSAQTKVTPNDSEVDAAQTKVTPDDSAQTKVTPDDADQTKVTPVDSAQTKMTPDDADQMQDSSTQTRMTPVDTDQTKDNAAQTKVTPVDADQTKDNAAQTKVTPVDADQTKDNAAQTKVTPVDADQTKVTPVDADQTKDDAAQTKVTPVDVDHTKDSAAQIKVTPDDASQTKVTPVDADQTKDDAAQTKVDADQTKDVAAQIKVTPDDTSQTKVTPVDADQTKDDAAQTKVTSDDEDAMQTQVTPEDVANDHKQTSVKHDHDTLLTPLTQTLNLLAHDHVEIDHEQTPPNASDESEVTTLNAAVTRDDATLIQEIPPDASETLEDRSQTQRTSPYNVVTPVDSTETHLTPHDTTQTPEDTKHVTQEDTESSEKLYSEYKSKGNRHVKKDEFTEAVSWYSKCIELFPDRTPAYNNRAFCHLKMKNAEAAERDCSRALELEPDNIKALYRRGVARKELGNYRDAMKDLRKLVALDSANAAGNKELESVKQLWEKELRTMQAKPNRSSTKETKSDQKSGTKRPTTSPFGSRGPTSTQGQVNTAGQATTKISTARAKTTGKGPTPAKFRSARTSAAEKGTKAKDKNSAKRVTPQTNTRNSAIERLLAVGEEEEEEEGEEGGGREGEGRKTLTSLLTTYYKEHPPLKRTKINIVEVENSSDEDEMVDTPQKRGEGEKREGSAVKGETPQTRGEGGREEGGTEGSAVKGETLQTRGEGGREEGGTEGSTVKRQTRGEGGMEEGGTEGSAVKGETLQTRGEGGREEGGTEGSTVKRQTRGEGGREGGGTEGSALKGETPQTGGEGEREEGGTEGSVVNGEAMEKMKEHREEDGSMSGDHQVTPRTEGGPQETETASDDPPPTLRLTSYEFVQKWNSIPRSAQSDEYANLLKLIPLQQLPEIITNKLDGTMLTCILKAIDEHFIPKEMYKLTADLLYNLSKVERFSMVSMFLSPSEKQGLSEVVATLSSQDKVELAPDILAAIKSSYGL